MAPDRPIHKFTLLPIVFALFVVIICPGSVNCVPPNYELQLVNGSSPNQGRVEIRASNTSVWLTLCGAYWDQEDGNVVCRELGFLNATSVSRTAEFGEGTGRVMSTNYQCNGDEPSLSACPVETFSEGDCQHSADAGVECLSSAIITTTASSTTIPPNNRVRLVGGDSPFQGRVEVYYNNVWGTICDDSWDTVDARIVCRQLGFNDVFAAITQARFGQGTGPIHLDDMRCYGGERSIFDCQHRGLGMHNCRHSEDAGVVCMPEARLSGGYNSSQGRVEIRINDEWATICGRGWDLIDGRVLCNQLGYGPAIEVGAGSTMYGQPPDGPVYISDLNCNSNFPLIYQCASRSVTENDISCTHDNDASVICSTTNGGTGIRLVGGNNIFEGRVEISIDSTWGTVCDDYWDLTDAKVVCRQLGLGRAVEARKYSSFGRGIGPIFMDDVNCNGNEDELLECDYNNETGCSHSEDAGVVCAPPIRLVGGKNIYQGRVEMYVNDAWGTICDNAWGTNEARVACRQLNYGYAATATQGSSFGRGSGPILAEDIGCSGYEGSLVQCNRFGIDVNTTCNHQNDAGVICSLPGNITLRLVDGQNGYEGRLEIELDGTWGTVCHNNWNKQDARVVCRQLGLGPGVEALGNSSFGEGSGPIYIDNLDCRGHESSIGNCPSNGVEVHNCTHKSDAGVVCSPPIRLVDGSSPFEGRVEILKNFIWGTVCDDGWDIKDANVVCRELGFGTAKRAVTGSYFGSRSYGSIHFDDVACKGDEKTLKDCPHKTSHDCSHVEDAGVVCTGQNLVCDLPVLPANTYMSIIKGTYRENEVIGVICTNGNNTVEWRCGPDKRWVGDHIVCAPDKEEEKHGKGRVIIGIVAAFVCILLIVVVLILIFVIRNQRNQNFGGAITMSDVLAHIEAIRHAGNSVGDGNVDGRTVGVTDNNIPKVDEETSQASVPYFEEKDSRSAATGGYARLIE